MPTINWFPGHMKKNSKRNKGKLKTGRCSY